ncbi:MAG: hypothetical protein AAB288_15415, partial [Acidobacteriota bacterium]
MPETGKLPVEKGWQIHGKVGKPVLLEPDHIDFEESLVRGMPFVSKRATATINAPFQSFEVACKKEGFSVRVERKDQSHTMDITVTPRADLPAGRFQFPIELNGIPGADAHVYHATLKVVGRVIEDCYASPMSISHGSRKLDDSATETLVLRSHSGKLFTVEGIKTSTSQLIVTPLQSKHDGFVNEQPYLITSAISRERDDIQQIE